MASGKKIIGGLGKVGERLFSKPVPLSSADNALPLVLPRANLSSDFINAEAERVARQMLGEHVVSGRPKETFNLAGRSMKESERVKGLDYVFKPTGTVAKEVPYSPKRGEVKVALPGDQTVSDKTLESLEGVPIDSPQQGGAYYGLGQKHLDDPEFWKSGESAAKGLQGKVDRVADYYEPDRVVGTHLAMGQASNNFAMHFADANLKAIDWSKASPKKISVFDNIVAGGYVDNKGNRVTFPNWPGLADPEAALKEMSGDSNLRKWFNNRMKVPSITEPLGLPNGLDIQYAITEPRVRDMEISMTGLMTGDLKPGALVEAAGTPHNTYTHRILGEAQGPQEVLTPFAIDFPDAAEHIASTKRPADFTGTIQKVYPHQVVDDQYINQYNEYRDRIKQLTGKKDGGAIQDDDQELKAMIADHLDSQAHDQELRAMVDNHLAGGGAPKAIAKGFKKLFANADEVAPVVKGGTRKFGEQAGGNTIMKETGGNWLTGSVEKGLQPLHRRTPGGKDPVEAIARLKKDFPENTDPYGVQRPEYVGRQIGRLEQDVALNKWVDSNLTNYVKKQMGTADDPVRKLAEEGIVHIPSEQVGVNRYRAPQKRKELGQPQLGQSDAAKAWEDASDVAVNTPTAKTIKENESLYQANPWIDKLSNEERVYALNQPASSNSEVSGLGFNHIMDVLRQDVAAGRIRPEQLNKVSMEQAVRRTHEFDQEMARRMAEAQIKNTAGMPTHKEYPDQGFKWIQLSQPEDLPKGWSKEASGAYVGPNGERTIVNPSRQTLEDSLKYEGDTMGHCVGSYCDDVAEGNSQIYSLRDAKGEPHVTIEVSPPSVDDYSAANQSTPYKPAQPRIVQIKGKGNAKPKEEYLPFVQDFVKSGNWSDIGDLQNTGLRRTSDAFNDTEQEFLRNKGVDLKPYIEPEETARYQELFKQAPPAEGMAEGGGAFKKIQWAKPQHFDGGGIASPEEQSIGYSSEPSKMYKEVKQTLGDDYDRLKSSARARAQYAKILAAQAAGSLADTVSFVSPLINSEGLANAFPMAKMAMTGITGSPVLGKRESVLSNERKPYSLSDALSTKEGDPIGGSEHIIKKAQEAGLMYGKPINVLDESGYPVVDPQTGEPYESRSGRFSPITEIGGSILGGLGLSKAGKGAVKGIGKLSGTNFGKMSPLQPEVTTALTGTPKGATYATKQDGPFYRVSPTTLDVSGAKSRGLREADELQGQAPIRGGAGQAGSQVSQRISDEEVARLISNPEMNEPLQIAKRFTKDTQGTDFTSPKIPESSLAKQSAIGRAHQLAVEGSPEYKTSVFDAYAREMPELLEQSGAKNYDDLMEKAYRQLAKETDDQFKQLPYNFSYHRAGEGDYKSSKEMMSDVHGNKHLYVFQGGDPHDFLNRIDKASGLNENEKFRAVHDLLGHAVYGNQFGPKGEEIAYAVHQQMYSPLARLAMASETRGQNSLVNYSPLNARLKASIAKMDDMEVEARRRGDTALVNELKAAKRQEYAKDFQFAPQKAVLLPPEFLDPKFAGGLPDYLSAANRPAKGTETESVLTHFSNDPNLQLVDPTRYGTGIKGAEAGRLNDFAGGVKDRSYFYLGEPGAISPEPGLGANRYRGESSNLYDITKDPLEFRTLARESNRTPFTARANAGITHPLQEANDYERLVKEYGYEGMINPNASKPMGIMFKPTPVQPRARGGLTQLKAR